MEEPESTKWDPGKGSKRNRLIGDTDSRRVSSGASTTDGRAVLPGTGLPFIGPEAEGPVSLPRLGVGPSTSERSSGGGSATGFSQGTYSFGATRSTPRTQVCLPSD